MAYVGGSQAHGAKLGATDDTDWYGLYVPPPNKILGLETEEHFVFTTGGKPGGNGPSDVDARAGPHSDPPCCARDVKSFPSVQMS